MITFTKPQKEKNSNTLRKVSRGNTHSLVVFNDDINTFEHVIDTLVHICKHSPEQAEQCAMIIHYKGKYAVKEGIYKDLAKMCQGISDRGISAEVCEMAV